MIAPLHFASQVKTSNFSFTGAINEVHNNYKFIKGKLILAGREPDGDSVAFIADNIELFKEVYRGYLLKPSTRDGSVQLRFEGIDTPELHYGTALQPMGVQARDYLLEHVLGFNPVYNPSPNPNHPPTVVNTSVPGSIPAFIATSALEIHGRPVSYLFINTDEFDDGETAPLHAGMLNKSVNYKMLESGYAYLLAYTSMPTAHYEIFKEVANVARSNKSGVWQKDATRDFILTDVSSVEGPDAQLIFPKLFRRCIDFFKSGEKDLKEWLRKTEGENDMVRITETSIVNMSSLIQQVNDHIYFQADTNDIIFIEK